jgi:type II secretory pathway pseudopilin PulG
MQNQKSDETKRKDKRKFYSFSLLELCLVIAIIAMISSVVTFQFHKALAKYRFETNVKKIETVIQFSHQLALSHQMDVALHFRQRKGTLFCSIEAEEREGFFLTDTKKSFCLKDISLWDAGTKRDDFSMLFFSSGYVSIPSSIIVTDRQKKYSKPLVLSLSNQ